MFFENNIMFLDALRDSVNIKLERWKDLLKSKDSKISHIKTTKLHLKWGYTKKCNSCENKYTTIKSVPPIHKLSN